LLLNDEEVVRKIIKSSSLIGIVSLIQSKLFKDKIHPGWTITKTLGQVRIKT